MNIFLYRPENFQNVCAITRSLEAFGINRCFVYDTNNIIRSHGRVLATVPVEQGVSIVDFDFQKDDLFVFGSESGGLPADIIHHADMSVYIPQYGVTESLNVSHAVAICAYEYRRRQHP